MLGLAGFAQLTANGLLNGALYALVGWAFALIIRVTGRFHLAFAFTYAAGAMVAAQVGASTGVPWLGALLIGGATAALLGAASEWVVYRRIAARAQDEVLLAVFVAALGISIAGTNALSLIWAGQSTLQVQGFTDGALRVGGVTVSLSSTVAAGVAVVLLAVAAIVMARTRAGRTVRAVAANPEMSRAVGIEPTRVFVAVFAVASFLGGVAAVLSATTTAASPTMGTQPLFYAFVVTFIARGTSVLSTSIVGFALGLVESWTGLFVDPAWSSIVVFAFLLVFVALRPFDVVGLLRRPLPVPRREAADGVRR